MGRKRDGRPKGWRALMDPYSVAFETWQKAERAVEKAIAAVAAARAATDSPDRQPRVLVGAFEQGGRPVPQFACSHAEIDAAFDRLLSCDGLDPLIDIPPIEAFRTAAHQAFAFDAELIMMARAHSGLAAAMDRLAEAEAERDAALEIMLATIPTTEPGRALLATFVHGEATFRGRRDVLARAARSLRVAMGREAFGDDAGLAVH